jgi:hypothetical protein
MDTEDTDGCRFLSVLYWELSIYCLTDTESYPYHLSVLTVTRIWWPLAIPNLVVIIRGRLGTVTNWSAVTALSMSSVPLHTMIISRNFFPPGFVFYEEVFGTPRNHISKCFNRTTPAPCSLQKFATISVHLNTILKRPRFGVIRNPFATSFRLRLPHLIIPRPNPSFANNPLVSRALRHPVPLEPPEAGCMWKRLCRMDL